VSLERLEVNPLLTPADVAPTQPGLEVLCTLNPGAVRFGDETILLVRVAERAVQADEAITILYYDAQADRLTTRSIPKDDPDLDLSDPRKVLHRGKVLLTSLSHLRVARSRGGGKFVFDPQPAIFPSTPYEAFGCEDARITPLQGRYYITYTAVSERGVTVALASTEDFKAFRRHGVIFPPYQKDVVIFPEKISNYYVCRHRPYMSEFNDACIWTAYSPDLLCWGRHEMTLAPRPGSWESGRVGCGGVPIRTEQGWLEIYHAADERGRYCLGAMLSDLAHPEIVLARSSRPVLEPQTDYETNGLFSCCVFSNGLVAEEDGTLTVYYGAADTVCAAAVTTVDEMVAAAKR